MGIVKKIFTTIINLTSQLIITVMLLLILLYGGKWLFGIHYEFDYSIGDYNSDQEIYAERLHGLKEAKEKLNFLSGASLKNVQYYREHRKELGDLFSDYISAYSVMVGPDFKHYFGSRFEIEGDYSIYYESYIRGLIKALQEGESIWYLPDEKVMFGVIAKKTTKGEIPYILQEIKYINNSYENKVKERTLVYSQLRYAQLKRMIYFVIAVILSILLGRLLVVFARRRKKPVI